MQQLDVQLECKGDDTNAVERIPIHVLQKMTRHSIHHWPCISSSHVNNGKQPRRGIHRFPLSKLRRAPASLQRQHSGNLRGLATVYLRSNTVQQPPPRHAQKAAYGRLRVHPERQGHVRNGCRRRRSGCAQRPRRPDGRTAGKDQHSG